MHDILTYIFSFFSQIYDLGDHIVIYDNNNITVTLNGFLLALFITGIVVAGLLNFAKGISAGSGVRVINRIRNRSKDEKE